MLTKKQTQVLDFIKIYMVKHSYAPSLEEIKRKFKLASVSTAHYYLKKLQEAGQLKKEFNQPRAVSTIEAKQTIEIPILGAIAAGQPIEAIEIPDETITITRDEIGKQGKHYAL
ncbi:MAG: hypothetical protein Q7R69_02145, partial [bacterium]|nr:hypothetical protein [bacterium]